MSDIRTQLAETIAAHQWDENRLACGCGEGDSGHWDYTAQQQAVHLADVLLALPDIAIIASTPIAPARVVEHAAALRRQNYRSMGYQPLEWDQLSDAQKVPWIIRAAAEREAGGEHR